MSRGPENTFIASVHRHLTPTGRNPYRMKNHNEFAGGIFDVWYSDTGADLWVEYKHIVIPKRATTLIVPELSALQLKWGRERHEEGRNVAVIVGCKEGGVVFFNLEWETGISAAAFKLRLQTRKDLAEWITWFTKTRPNTK